MVSIIVPVYKVEKYLRKCVESILSQTYRNIEVILVDDGSPDTCGKICDEFAQADGRVKVIHQENQGQAAARNRGLLEAQGAYITFVDSDDFVTVDFIETLLNNMNAASADISMCGHNVVYEDSCYTEEKGSGSVEQMGKDQLWDEVFGKLNNAVWNKLYKKSLLYGLSFPEDLGHGEDLLFNLEYINRCSSAVKTDKVCYYYLKRRDSVTTSGFSARKLMEIESKDRALALVEAFFPAQKSNAEKYCFRARMNVIRSIYKAGKEKEYSEQLSQYREYLGKSFTKVRHNIRKKEQIEYFLFITSETMYSLIVKSLW